MILIRELSTAFSIEAGAISSCNGSMQAPEQAPESAAGSA
jgi:hypothetical protein